MTGLRINTAKTMMTSWNNPAGIKVQVDREELEAVSKFVYLGGTVAQEGGLDEDIKSRLGKTRAAFSKLRNIWKSSQLKLKTRLKIFKGRISRFSACPYTDWPVHAFWHKPRFFIVYEPIVSKLPNFACTVDSVGKTC